MFDIGTPELLTVAVIALLVLGPERLPEAVRALGTGWGRLRRQFDSTRKQIEAEIGFDRIRQQLDEEGTVAEIKALKIELNGLAGQGDLGLSELADTRQDPSNPRHWPGMPPPDH